MHTQQNDSHRLGSLTCVHPIDASLYADDEGTDPPEEIDPKPKDYVLDGDSGEEDPGTPASAE